MRIGFMYTQIKQELKEIKCEIYEKYSVPYDFPINELEEEILGDFYENFKYIMEEYNLDEDEFEEILEEFDEEESELNIVYDPKKIKTDIEEVLVDIYKIHNISINTDFNILEENIKEELYDALDKKYIISKYDLDTDEVDEIVEEIYWDRLKPLKIEQLNKAMEYVFSVDVWEKESKYTYTTKQLTPQVLMDILNESLKGKYSKVLVHLMFDKVKEINENEYKELTDKIAIYQEKENIALLYFCKENHDCYKYIRMEKCPCGNRDLEETMIGSIEFLECVVHNNKETVAKGISYIFANVESISEFLKVSGRWCPEYLNADNYNIALKEYGVEE